MSRVTSLLVNAKVTKAPKVVEAQLTLQRTRETCTYQIKKAKRSQQNVSRLINEFYDSAVALEMKHTLHLIKLTISGYHFPSLSPTFQEKHQKITCNHKYFIEQARHNPLRLL